MSEEYPPDTPAISKMDKDAQELVFSFIIALLRAYKNEQSRAWLNATLNNYTELAFRENLRNFFSTLKLPENA